MKKFNDTVFGSVIKKELVKEYKNKASYYRFM